MSENNSLRPLTFVSVLLKMSKQTPGATLTVRKPCSLVLLSSEPPQPFLRWDSVARTITLCGRFTENQQDLTLSIHDDGLKALQQELDRAVATFMSRRTERMRDLFKAAHIAFQHQEALKAKKAA